MEISSLSQIGLHQIKEAAVWKHWGLKINCNKDMLRCDYGVYIYIYGI